MLEDWEIDISAEEASENDNYKDIILAEIGSMRLAVSFISGPVPNGEAEHYAAAGCLKQPAALGIYTDGAVFEPDFYRQFSLMLKENELPLMNWIWFGLYQNLRSPRVRESPWTARR